MIAPLTGGIGVLGRARSGAAASPLITSLAAYWALNDTAWTDSIGGLVLTPSGSPTSTAGKLGNAATFVAASSQALAINDTAAVSAGDVDFTVAAWIKLASKGATRYFISKWSPLEYLLYFDNAADRLLFAIFSTTGSFVFRNAATFGSPPTGTWMYVVAWHDATANTVNIQVNNGTVDSTAHTTGIADNTSAFRIGGLSGNYWDGQVDEVGVWKRVLTAPERTQLYNSGAGLAYPFS